MNFTKNCPAQNYFSFHDLSAEPNELVAETRTRLERIRNKGKSRLSMIANAMLDQDKNIQPWLWYSHKYIVLSKLHSHISL